MTEQSSQRRRATITVLVILAAMMQTLDTTIVNVALPYVQGSVAASNDQITWVLTSYITAAAIMTPPTGFLAARFGLKRLFIVSTLGFTLASMLCGMAESLTQIVAFRLLQGAFGAAMIPLSQTVLLTIYPKERHGFAMALFGIGVVVGPVLGPVLGGWLTENYTWRYVFYINGPLGIIGILGMMMFLPESPGVHCRNSTGLALALLAWQLVHCKFCWTAARSRIGSVRAKSSLKRLLPARPSICFWFTLSQPSGPSCGRRCFATAILPPA